MGGWGEDEALVDMMRVDQFQARNLQRRSGQKNFTTQGSPFTIHVMSKYKHIGFQKKSYIQPHY